MTPTQVTYDIQPVPVPSRRFTPSAKSKGLMVAILSCAAFGTSGTFATALLNAGWTPVTAVAARITIAALVLAIPTILSLRGRWHVARDSWRAIVLYGIFGVAGCQLFYFNAVTHVSVGVALLLEYLAPVLLVGYAWARFGRTPRALTITGTIASIVGLLFVIDVFSGFKVDPIGIGWGLAAALCLCVYFIIAGDEESELPSIALAGGGMAVGATILLALVVTGTFPVAVSAQTVELAGANVPFWVAILGLALVAAALAYVTGIYAARELGTRVASFVSLLEVVFAVGFAWYFLAQQPTVAQLVGGAFILAGVIAVRLDETRHGEDFGPVAAAEHELEPTDSRELILSA